MTLNTNASLRTNAEFQGKISNKGCMSWKHLLGMVADSAALNHLKQPVKTHQDNYMIENNPY